MKIPKTFRLTERAITILDAQENATEFLEELIMSEKQTYSKAEAEIIDLLNEIKKTMGTPSVLQREPQIAGAPLENKNPKNKTVSPTAKSILTTIRDLEHQRDTMFSQDPEDFIEINANIQNLWKEYHAEKETSN